MNDASSAVHGRIREWRYRPPRGLGNAHVQTLLGTIRMNWRRAHIRRERWELPDGDFCDLDWLDSDRAGSWALVVPGITGSLDSPGIRRLIERLNTAGYRAGVLNHRGLSGEPNRFPQSYHAGFTRDLDLVTRSLAAHYGPGIAVGFSMGGNLLLKWLGENGTDVPLRAAAAVSVPFRLGPAADSLSNGKSASYGRYLTRALRKITRRKFARVPPPFAVPPLASLASLREFDEHITAPLHGFTGAADYYKRASCFPWLTQVAVPTLILNALDDPLIPRSSLPAEIDLSAPVTLELAEHGGHVGFLGRNRYGLPRFALNDHLLTFWALSEM